MKILHVMPYCPVPTNYGARLRIYNLTKYLSLNHEVTVVFTGLENQAEALRAELNGGLTKVIACPYPLTRRVKGLAHLRSFLGSHSILWHLGASHPLRGTIEAELADGSYDVVLTEFPHMAFFDLPAGPIRVLDGHNIEYDNFRRMAEKSRSAIERFIYRNETRKFYPEELAAFRRQDLLLFTSERDRRMARQEVPEVPSAVIPNGVDTAYFTAPAVVPKPCSMVFTGILDYVPNSDGISWFLDEVFPLIVAMEPRASITVVGAHPGHRLLARTTENVRFTGYVDDVRPYVHGAEVTVVPLRMGGGTRLKILESFAMRNPVVSTPIGAEGIDIVNGEHGLIASKPHDFAEAAVRLFRDRELNWRITANASALVREKYEWSVIGRALEESLERALQDSGGREAHHVH